MARKTNKTIMGVFFFVFILMIGFIAFSVTTLKSLKKSSPLALKNAPIAVIKVEGVIMESMPTIELLHTAEKDKKFKAIIMRINSPGGAVGPTQEIYEEMRRIDENVKPVYASFGSVAASGGYYLGAGARKIYANAGAITGSIGVIMNFLNLSKLFDYLKVDPKVVKAGRYKDLGNTNREMTAEEKLLLKGMLDQVHTQFKNDILKTRKDKLKGDINEMAQGQIFSGEEALNLGLVDALGGLYVAGREIHKELKLEEKFGLKVVEKKKKVGLREIIEQMESVTDLSGLLSGLLSRDLVDSGMTKKFNIDMFRRYTPVPMYLMP